jgi:outer membrane protein OmpA-like peptidoglycan-associated protein
MPMRRPCNGLLSLIPALFLLAGCVAGHTVVLVPDPDGHLGKAEITTTGGSRLLEKSGDMTHVSGPSAQPSPVTAADPKYIASTFADVLAIEPLQPEKFILFFESGKTALTPQSQEAITDIVQAIKRRGAISVAVSGHTDSAGSALLNDRLAHERAELVRELLIRNGTNPDYVTVSSHGQGNPLVPTPDGVAEPRNRRVEVILR